MAFMSTWTNRGQNKGFSVAPSKITLEFELSRIFQFYTTGCARLSDMQTKQAKKLRSTCRVIHSRSSVSISLLSSSGFWTFGSAILRKTNASRRMWKTSRRKRYGALRIARTPMYKERLHSEYSIFKAYDDRQAPDNILLSMKNPWTNNLHSQKR